MGKPFHRNTPAQRTPKAKIFVHGPYIDCPECRGEKTFGVLMICDHHYVRRCINCWLDEQYRLPPIKKKIIYLDQFVISNMTKELDPERPKDKQTPNSAFFFEIFDKLDRLSKLQLIIMPHSQVQEDESIVDPNYEKFRAVFKQLSHGISLNDPEEILQSQIFDAFLSWSDPTRVPEEHHYSSYFTADPHVWNERIRIDLNYIPVGVIPELQQIKAEISSELKAVVTKWRNATVFDFQATFKKELMANGSNIWSCYAAHMKKQLSARLGRTAFTMDLFGSSPQVETAMHILRELASKSPDPENVLKRFLLSDSLETVPTARISALFWATLARQVRTITNPDKVERFCKASVVNDVKLISSYSLHCDAMFIDNDMMHLVKQRELAKEFCGKARLFSLNSRTEFIAYLNEIEANATKAHRATVNEVYGEDGCAAFIDVLSILKKK